MIGKGDEAMAKSITFEIQEHIGAIYSTIRGRREGGAWTKEVTLTSWNGGVPKIDIRDWTEDYERCGKGITLTEAEAREVAAILTDYFSRKDGE